MKILEHASIFISIWLIGIILLFAIGGITPRTGIEYILFNVFMSIILYQHLTMETREVDAELFRSQYLLLRAVLDDDDEDDDEEEAVAEEDYYGQGLA